MSNVFPIPEGGSKSYASFTLPIELSNFGTHFSHFGVGGFVELPDINYRNAIPIADEMNSDGVSSGRRKLGMIVYIVEQNRYFQLLPVSAGSPVTPSQWSSASDAQKMVWLDPTQDREDVTGASPTYDLILGSHNPDDAWREVYLQTNPYYLPLSGGVIEGPLGVTETLTVTGNGLFKNDLTVEGDLTVLGTTLTINSEDLVVKDALIRLADGNKTDLLDIGFVGQLSSLPLGKQYSGLYRDASDDGKWTLFSKLTTEPILLVDPTDPHFQIDTLKANIEGNLMTDTTVFGSLSVGGQLSAAVIRLPSTTSSSGGIRFGTDAGLYRSSASTVKTVGSLVVGTLPVGTTNSVITNNSNKLAARNINPAIWNTTVKFLTASAGSTLTPNYVLKASTSSALTNGIIYDNGTNIGIGTTTPSEKLSITGSLSATDYIYGRTRLKFVTNNYVLQPIDQNSLLLFDTVSPVSAFIPQDSSFNFAVGTSVDVTTLNSIVYVVGNPGVTVRAADGRNYLRTTNSTATVLKIRPNEWLLFGDLWTADLGEL